MGFDKIGLDNEFELNKPSEVTVYVNNTGPTNALNATLEVKVAGIFPLNDIPVPTFDKVDKVEDESVGMIPAGTKYMRDETTGQGQGTLVAATFAATDPRKYAAYRAKTMAVVLFARAQYNDIFRPNIRRESILCMTHRFGEATYDWGYCRTGNSMK